ncbi:MAG: DUF3047 domain-containing protein [Desulfatirhabdiaceae bacterium]
MTSMFLMRIRHPVLVIFCLIFAVTLYAEDEILFREDFATLANWEPLIFPKISRHTTYFIEKQDDTTVLVADSHDGASALVYRQTFDISSYSTLHWRWKVDRVYSKGDYRQKSGDDYPLRVYVMFEYAPENASVGQRISYGLAKAIYGRYPPHSSLNYIWANRDAETEPVFSPYTDRSIMIPLESGSKKVGQWVDETVNLREDYRKAFGENPPAKASLAIMNDSDNTGEYATAYIQFIEVRK